jgi:2-succinyl-6-hydroxy-2,4-cyclohexadiene-1-carboxylate synthase
MTAIPDWGRGFTHPLSGGGRIRVRETGEGPPLLLLHGFTGSSLSWDPAIVQRLGRSFRVLAPDLPGHGLSPVPEPDPADQDAGYGIEWLAAELRRLMEGGGAERFSVLGYSMGGRVALAMAVAFPESITALILESASPGLEDEEARADRRRSDEQLARAVMERGMDWFGEHWRSVPLFETRRGLPEAVSARLDAILLLNDPAGLAFALRRFGTGVQPSIWNDLSRVQAPTLLMAGAVDKKFARINRAMAPEIDGSRLVVIPGIGHTVHLEAPDLWADLVSLHLQRHSISQGPPPVLRTRG